MARPTYNPVLASKVDDILMDLIEEEADNQYEGKTNPKLKAKIRLFIVLGNLLLKTTLF